MNTICPLQGFQKAHGALLMASSGRSCLTTAAPSLQGFQADQGALRGFVLMEADDRLRYFPADALPAAPVARFAALFEARPRWAADDIAPFLDGVQVGTRDSVIAPGVPIDRATSPHGGLLPGHPSLRSLRRAALPRGGPH